MGGCGGVLSVFFNDTATTEIYTLSLHDALPIWFRAIDRLPERPSPAATMGTVVHAVLERLFDLAPHERTVDRKSTRLNSSHANISYAVFCLKKKNSPPSASLIHAQLSSPAAPST